MPSDEKPDILSVWLELGGGEPHRSTGWVKVKCALHEERTASATINEDAQRWNCFVCAPDKPGDVYDLVMRAEGIKDFSEAKQRAEVLAGHRSREVRGKSDQGGPRIPGRKGDQRDRRAYRPAWRVP